MTNETPSTARCNTISLPARCTGKASQPGSLRVQRLNPLPARPCTTLATFATLHDPRDPRFVQNTRKIIGAARFTHSKKPILTPVLPVQLVAGLPTFRTVFVPFWNPSPAPPALRSPPGNRNKKFRTLTPEKKM
jgi:hypothetical protein